MGALGVRRRFGAVSAAAWLVHTATGVLLPSVLRKPFKALTVSVGYRGELAPEALRELSLELRRRKAATIWTADVEAVKVFAEEQATARGDFPGPCPVVYCGPDPAAALVAGADAVVLDAAAEAPAEADAQQAVIRRASTADQVSELAGACLGLLIPGASFAELAPSLPKGCLAVASLEVMQPEQGEIDQGRALLAAGCTAVLLEDACVGDEEDLPYVNFAVKKLTSKASSTFKVDGLTGAVNGHFGSAIEDLDPKRPWKRTSEALEAPELAAAA